ncbi:MAG: molybdopterin molybdotransferase MoeA [Gammaproteobacteria bacterium]|nr:MAG: molybdopterin molybdotransferase MoeA [Gammaproteobacteria bacterium]
MISFETATRIILDATDVLPSRTVRLADAFGTAVAEDIRSTSAVPSFANAAMDGFALRSAETAGASAAAAVTLEIAGSIAAGQAPPAATPPGTAWEIMTGAPLPADCDAVLPVEQATTRTPGTSRRAVLLLREPVAAGRNRRDAATDFAPGDVILRAGRRVDAPAMMALAAAGFDSLPVRSPPRVAVLTTGSELTNAGAAAAIGLIRDANGPYLAAALTALGLPLVAHRSAPDDPERLARELLALAPAADLLLTTGGVSAGRLDCLPEAIGRIGGEVLFHKVAIRPGKPLLLARLPQGALLFSLPGNPMAVAVGLRFFVIAAVRALLGDAPEVHTPARLQAAVLRRPALTFFAKALVRVGADATLTAQLLAGQESFRIAPLLTANGWAIIPPGDGELAAGEIVEVAPLLPGAFPARGN